MIVACLSALALIAPLTLPLGAIAVTLLLAIGDAFLVRVTPAGTRTFGTFSRGAPTELSINVTPTKWASRVEVRQPLGPDMRANPSSMSTKPNFVFELTSTRRGSHDLSPLSVRQIGPLGLGSWRHSVGDSSKIRVFADIPTAQKLARAVRLGTLRPVGQTRRGPLGLGTDFESLREYRPDDDVRQINWRATARMGRAMSNNLRVEQDRDLYCLVDAGRLTAAPFQNATDSWIGGGPTAGERAEKTAQQASKLANDNTSINSAINSATNDPTTGGTATNDSAAQKAATDGAWQTATRLDTLLDAVSAVALVADEVGDRVGTIVYTDEILRRRSPTRRGGAAVIETTFDLDAIAIESEPERAALAVGSPRSALVMIFTDLIDPSAARSLTRAVVQLSRRHEVVVVSSIDPVLQEYAEPTSARATAIATALKAHQQTISALYNSGASVVIAPPNQLAKVTARAYVDSRARPRRITISQ